MDGGKEKQNALDLNKKRKTTTTMWRPVCTQAISNEECLEKNVVIESEAGSQVQEGLSSTSGTVSNVKHVLRASDAVTEITQSSSTLDHSGKDRVLEREPELSTEKHSISVERIYTEKDRRGVISGVSIDGVTRASEKIQTIIDEAVKSPSFDYTHFISLPLAIHPELVDKLLSFQNSILGNKNDYPGDNQNSDSDEETTENEDGNQQTDERPDVAVELKVNDRSEHVKVNITKVPLVSYPRKASTSLSLSDMGIDKSIFIKPKTFHLTVLMLKLWNEDRVNAAAEVLQSISSRVMDALGNQPVSIRLKGLDCMKGSLDKARVLYAPVEEIGGEDRLLRACQVIIDAYIKAGLVLEKDAKQRLKLHATVMNARHRKRRKRTRNVDSFDARGIFKQYGSEEWGEYLIREAHLSQRFVFDDNGYYHCCGSIPFPENKLTTDAALDPAGLVAIAICHGFALFVAVSVSANISGGHVNPAVTFGLALGGQITVLTGILYWIAQLVGSIVACFLLKAVTGGLAIPIHSVAAGVGAIEGVVMEIIITFALVYTVYATAADPKKGSLGTIAPIAIGFIVGANILAAGPFSGGSMNPARSFGPAVVSGNFYDNWIYWVGPLVGGGLAGLIYGNVFMHSDHAPLARDY